ncbi:hypothetical protein HPCU_06530 [Helicobacter pylori Cuz20]|uniref:Uncharacterized protein n=1 Tax=Helicobacter pylori (strain Cuz20) TaxID=765964 RepID=A0AB32X9E2_HELPC|nr:hypothetical protein [Helicobacter pylori]ADO04450.1 hypothetical protein HPCU_06530 [Helicobacter pylori Cuz20]AFI01468.1 hypothetical protein HPSH112_06395 [Helicobacter pylori Shi112]
MIGLVKQDQTNFPFNKNQSLEKTEIERQNNALLPKQEETNTTATAKEENPTLLFFSIFIIINNMTYKSHYDHNRKRKKPHSITFSYSSQ